MDTKDSLVNRKPAVAGQFYPADPKELRNQLVELFAKAQPNQCSNVIAIIVPHAGYVFSGGVAASAFNQIDTGRSYDNIFVIASSHHELFDGASIYTDGNYLTPLGEVKVNLELARKLKKENKVFDFGSALHNNEHALEVELPFLQYHMKKDFSIIPIMVGTQKEGTCKKIGEALKPYFNSNNLFIISSDFSHYPAYKDAIRVDKATADAILANSPALLIATMQSNEASSLETSLCSWPSVLSLLYMTQNNPDITTKLIQYKNSGDSPEGNKDNVVGYNAIAFSLKNDGQSGQSFINLTKEDKQELLMIARSTLEIYLKQGKTPEFDASHLSKNLLQACGAFVTLNKDHNLRGCIGRFTSDEPLYKVVQEMAIAAATNDYRFDQVQYPELKNIKIEISVLTPMKKIKSIDEIILGKHGIYIVKGSASGTFLPQVATETKWTKEEFLGHCARDKAGIGWDGWKNADIYIYEAIVFEE
jgi:AmmeMemoRadiSam system protein B/AmmeMemoRadiSam system protein A